MSVTLAFTRGTVNERERMGFTEREREGDSMRLESLFSAIFHFRRQWMRETHSAGLIPRGGKPKRKQNERKKDRLWTTQKGGKTSQVTFVYRLSHRPGCPAANMAVEPRIGHCFWLTQSRKKWHTIGCLVAIQMAGNEKDLLLSTTEGRLQIFWTYAKYWTTTTESKRRTATMSNQSKHLITRRGM